MVATQSESGVNGKNIRELSFIALFSLIFGSMMGSGVFDIPQNISHSAGALAVIIGWIITAIGMLSLGWVFAYVTIKRPDIQSGIYGYAKYGFGDYIGFNAAWGYWLNALLGNASYLVYIFATLGNFAWFKYFGAGTTFSSFVAESVVIWLIYCLIAQGINTASIVNVLITTVKIIGLAAVVIVFIYGFNWHQFKLNLASDLHFGTILTQVKSTMLVTVWDFLGIEAACIYALRATNIKDVAKATILGVIVVFSIDALISILPFGIMPSALVGKLATPSTAGVVALISGEFSARFIRIAVLISVIGALLAWMMLATNILYLAASDGALPASLAVMNKRKVPYNALLLSTIVLQLFVLNSYLTQSVYLIMIQLATSLILVPYLLCALFAFKLIITELKFDYFSLFKGVIAVLYAIWLIYAGGLKYLAFSTVLYSVGIIVYASSRRQQGKTVFSNSFEKATFILLILAAVISVYCWAIGALRIGG